MGKITFRKKTKVSTSILFFFSCLTAPVASGSSQSPAAVVITLDPKPTEPQDNSNISAFLLIAMAYFRTLHFNVDNFNQRFVMIHFANLAN